MKKNNMVKLASMLFDMVVEGQKKVQEAESVQYYYVKLLSPTHGKLMAMRTCTQYLDMKLDAINRKINTAPCVLYETTDIEKAKTMLEELKKGGAKVDSDIYSQTISAEGLKIIESLKATV